MRISDWSSDVCSSDLAADGPARPYACHRLCEALWPGCIPQTRTTPLRRLWRTVGLSLLRAAGISACLERRSDHQPRLCTHLLDPARSEEHTSELQSLMRLSYAVFCLKKKKTIPLYIT